MVKVAFEERPFPVFLALEREAQFDEERINSFEIVDNDQNVVHLRGHCCAESPPHSVRCFADTLGQSKLEHRRLHSSYSIRPIV
jgi:hypothetical protein